MRDKARGFHGYKLHSNALLMAAELIKQVEGETHTINQVLDEKSHMQVLKNRKIVKSIAETVHFLTKQNLPLRGHMDDSQSYDTQNINPGNFQELLKFSAHASDTLLKTHLE